MKYILAVVLWVLASGARAQEFSPVPFVFATGAQYVPSQVMADFQAVINGGNAAGAKVDLAVQNLVVFSAGAIVPFYLASCPTGWAATTAANNRFLRGLDQGAGVDPGNSVGQQQANTFTSHTHSTGNFLTGLTPGGYNFGSVSGTFINNGVGSSSNYTGGLAAGGGVGETRPANLVLLFCTKA